jgi:hypothetical protein
MQRISGVLFLLAMACGGAKVAEPPSNKPVEPKTGTGGSAEPAATPDGTQDAKLRVTSVAPEKGDTQGGTYVVVKGSGFLEDGPRQVKIYFGTRQGTVVRFQSDSEVIVQAPGGNPNEVVDVLVLFVPGGQRKLPQAFTYIDRSATP